MPAKRKTATARKQATRTTKKSNIKLKKTTLRVAKKAKPTKAKAKAKTTRSTGKTATARQAKPALRATQKPAIHWTADEARAQLGRLHEPLTKSQFIAAISEWCELSKKDVNNVFECLNGIIQAHLAKNGPQIFKLPGLLKFYVQHKPAQKARQGINPFTGEMTTFKAKPAKDVVKVRLLKQAKEFAN